MPDPFRLPSPTAAGASRSACDGAVLIDMRKPSAAAWGRRVVGVQHGDPCGLGHADRLVADPRRLIAFCVHGHEVSRFGCALLRMHGRVAAGAPAEEAAA